MADVDLLIVPHVHVAALCVSVLCQDGFTVRFDLDTSTKQQLMYPVRIAGKILVARLNIVRAGVAEHPSEWPFSESDEIQKPRRKCKLIAYDQLRELLGFETHDHLRAAHRSWVHEALKDGNRVRDAKWS